MVKNKSGQVTIFIIVAILIIAIGVLIYMFYPKIKTTITTETTNPYSFIQECLEEKIEESVAILSLQGGSMETSESNSYYYDGNYVKYLCYTEENFVECVNQEPFLKKHVEEEILNEISEDVVSCFDSLEQSYENKGYDVNLQRGATKVKLFQKRIVTSFEHELTLTKGESEKYDSFEIVLQSNLYGTIDIVNNIISWEMEFGDSATEVYIMSNPNIKIEKRTKDDDVKIYIITYKETGEVFQFAVRSIALPPGY